MLFIYQMRRFVLIFCFFLCGFKNADDLAFSKGWLALVHYQPAMFGGYTATIGSDDFYLSPVGRGDPKAELAATIELFEAEGQEQKKCLFPARFLFLKKHGLLTKDFPKCDEYEQLKKDLAPSGVTLLFTDAYMNNSSSLFGHTLFRIDTSRKGTQLLAHGINYGAYTRGFEDTPFYAIYGLLGFFKGGLTIKPYYDIINTYNNIENRDIWEYHLDLTDEELDFFVAHIWEIGHTATPYYFLSRNCSYMLAEILDAIKPDLNLASEFKVYTIPLDTVKIVDKSKLVKSTTYRPSRLNKIKHRLKQMNKAQYKAFLQLTKGKKTLLENLEENQKSDVLETAYQYTQYRYVKKDLDLKTYRNKSFMLLSERNKIKAGQTFDELKEGQNPVFSHNSAAIALGAGFENGHAFQEFVLRPAYHSLTDNPKGYLKGAAINFLQTHIRHIDYHDKYVLQDLKVLELASLSPIDRVFAAPSYRLDIDLLRTADLKTKKRGHIFNSEFNMGGTYALSDNFWIYGLAGLEGAYGGFLKNNFSVGASGILGTLLSFDKFGFEAQIKQTLATDKSATVFEQKAVASYHLSQNINIEAQFKRQAKGSATLNEWRAFIKYFY